MTETPQPAPGTQSQPVGPPVAPQPMPPMGQIPNAPGGLVSMVCGIVGVATGCLGLVLGIVALIHAKKARQALAQYPTGYGGAGMATAGFVLGIIATILGSLWMIYIVIWIVVAVALVANAAG